jgi:lipid-binding SYLF domain-containing protein
VAQHVRVRFDRKAGADDSSLDHARDPAVVIDLLGKQGRTNDTRAKRFREQAKCKAPRFVRRLGWRIGEAKMKKCVKSFSFLVMVLVLLIGQGRADAASAAEINAGVNETLGLFYRQVPGSRELLSRAVGVLVFPTVIKAGMGFGGEYGEGAMRVGGKTTDFYNTISASFGFQLGAEARSVIIMFMTPEALSNFHRVDGFKIGVDGSVAIITIGAGGSIDTDKITSPVIGFILDPKGLMYNLTLEGSKITRMHP